jgi:hypothetical protein
MRQEQFDHLCEIARRRIQADITDQTSVNSLIVEAIDHYLKEEQATDTPDNSGSPSESDQDVFSSDGSPFYRYG